ncbi:MAG: SMC-Scp complex subunit ScpB [Bdellovibrionales bacterium CG10_big_fil_rev_8_21_14_0_10_45_34]|nr:MAG: SMC-Scp complex subunit ScpB [Bdellovibrionales bacterium CG10_big_fil_rev_8_21_14_0_10_45_34]
MAKNNKSGKVKALSENAIKAAIEFTSESDSAKDREIDYEIDYQNDSENSTDTSGTDTISIGSMKASFEEEDKRHQLADEFDEIVEETESLSEESQPSVAEFSLEEESEMEDPDFTGSEFDELELKATELDKTEKNDSEESASEELQESVNVSGTELEAFESAEIEETEFIEASQVKSILESILFSTDKPLSFDLIHQAFKGSNVTRAELRSALESYQIDLADSQRGVTLEIVANGYQLRTKIDNQEYLKRMIKGRPFKVSGPALEVLSIVAYKQPIVKSEVDQIRGVESGHLLRALMDRGLIKFGERSDLPGKPMNYESTRKFLEIFGLRNLKELPSLSDIESLIPEGIDEVEEKPKLADLTDDLSMKAGVTYSEGEQELERITGQLTEISATTEFFEQEKIREKARKDKERAEDVKELLALGREVPFKDVRWLEKYERELLANSEPPIDESGMSSPASGEAITSLESEESLS